MMPEENCTNIVKKMCLLVGNDGEAWRIKTMYIPLFPSNLNKKGDS